MLSFSTHKDTFASWSDKKLVSSVLNGNQQAIVYFFYTKFSGTFQYHIYKLLGYSANVADLVDEFFLYMFEDNWRRLRTYDSSVASLNTWISTVSFRFFRDYKRAKIDLNGVVTINDQWETMRKDWVQHCDAGMMMDIQSAIDRIRNERDRKIACRLLLEDKEYRDVAEEFGLTVDYVYTVKNRVLKQIKKNLQEYV